MNYSVQNIRNVCLLGHSGSGKTSLAESLLYVTGAIDRMGRTVDGNTVCDYDAEEIKRGFTYLKMDLGIELMLDEEGCLNAPLGMLEDYKKYSMKAINHQKGSIDRDMMLGKNYEVFTIPHYATGIHVTEKGMDYLENYVKEFMII